MRRVRLTAVLVLLATALAACGSSAKNKASTSPSPGKLALANPVGLLVAGHTVWVASSGTGAVVGLDAGTAGRKISVPVGATPLRLAWDGHLVWASVFGAGRVVAIDPARGAVVRRVAVSGQPEGIVAAFGSIWVVRQQARALSRITPDGRVAATYRIGQEPRLVAAGKSALFVSDHAGGTVTRIDPATGQSRASGRLCDGPQDLVPYAGTLWVSCTAGNEVIAVDEKTMTVTGRVSVPGEPDGLDATGGTLRVVATKGPTLYELDADPHAPKVHSSTSLGSAAPLQDRANDDVVVTGSTAWVSSFADGAVLRALA